MILNEIHRTDSLKQVFPHVHESFPYMMFVAEVEKYPGGMIPWHWHEEIEFFTVLQGNLRYSTNYESISLSAGEGAFINSNVMHQYEPLPGPPLIISGEVFRTSILSSGKNGIYEQKYIAPILENEFLDTLVLRIASPIQRRILSHLRSSQDAADLAEFGYEIEVRNHLSLAWFLLLKEMDTIPKVEHRRTDQSSERIKKMIKYINEHYSEKISLDDIASAANVSKRECLRCFQSNLGLSPFAYLLRHRCQTAAEKLRDEVESITEIAYSCGFSDSNYFNKVFKNHMGMSPSSYRKNIHR